MPDPEDTDSRWLVIVPTLQLTVSDVPPISGKWVVGDITFMSPNAMTAYLHQPNLPYELDEQMREVVMTHPIMGEHTGFAVTTRTGTPKEIRRTVFRDLLDAAHVLASTNSVVSERSGMRGFTLQGLPFVSARKDCFGNRRAKRAHLGGIIGA